MYQFWVEIIQKDVDYRDVVFANKLGSIGFLVSCFPQ